MRRIVFASLLASAAVLGAACGGGNSDDGSESTDADGNDADAADDSMDTPDDGMQPDAPPLEGTPHMLTVTIPNIQPGEEGTKCIWVRLDNAEQIRVRQIHNVLSSASHHLIVYRNNMDTTEQTTPIDCDPFTGALNTTGGISPFMITQKRDDLLTLPDRVAFTLAPTQMIKLEMHYQNATEAPFDAVATVNFLAVDPSTIDHEADLLFIGSPDIDIAPGATQTLAQKFTVPSYLDLSQSKIFAITGHQHKLGTGVTVGVGPAAGPFTDVYSPDGFQWDEPETVDHRPGFSVPVGGAFDFTCSWTNTTNQRVEFGEGVNDEMCFFWAYYYPSQGSKVCVHTDQFGGQDLCCPGNQQICDYLAGQF
jgi:hypothetical protein